MRARKRRIALVAGVAIALGGAGTLSISGVTGADLARAAVTQAGTLADLFNARSPGDRTQAQLTKTKRARALGRTRSRAVIHHQVPSAPTVEVAKLLTTQPPLPVGLERPLPLAAISTPPSLAMIVSGGGGGGGGVLPPGGGGGGVLPPGGGCGPATFPSSEPRQPITAPSALPEPGTWATMLLGFGFIGWRVRRRRGPQIAGQPA